MFSLSSSTYIYFLLLFLRYSFRLLLHNYEYEVDYIETVILFIIFILFQLSIPKEN